jgi:outer membrane protein OmpA-like peptidoglycan-associated protein
MTTPKLVTAGALLLALAGVGPVLRAQEEESDQPKAKDTAYFSGMPSYEITSASEKEFDAYNFYDGKGCNRVEGRKHLRTYSLKEGAAQASDLQIARNYAEAVRRMGGTVVFDAECAGAACAENCGYRMVVGKAAKGGKEIWVEVVPYNDGTIYDVTLVEREAMRQDVTAKALLDALSREGHVALYINFDSGKATIRPDSQPVVDQVVEMLRGGAELKLAVEGHTDNVGSPASNKALSESRAKAVVAALVAKGIDAARLAAVGWGQDRPVADNGTEDGRAKNRRVELVKK